MNYRQKEDFKNCLYIELSDTNIENDVERSTVEKAIEIVVSA